jgi:hypothetical protein
MGNPSQGELMRQQSGILKPDLFPEIISQVSMTITDSLRAEFQDLLKSRENCLVGTTKEIEEIRAQQKKALLLAEGAGLKSEGAKKQFAAFAKVKSGIADTHRLLQSHDILGALGILEETEKVAGLHLNTIKRADLCTKRKCWTPLTSKATSSGKPPWLNSTTARRSKMSHSRQTTQDLTLAKDMEAPLTGPVSTPATTQGRSFEVEHQWLLLR